MRRWRNAPAIGLATLVAASAVGYVLTRDRGAPAATKAPGATTPASLMDQRLLQTARTVAATAETADESAFAAEALRLADHELDQAFATALREASTSAASLPPALQQLAERRSELRSRVSREQERLAQLTKENPDSDAVALAKAQLALDRDELEDAEQDLARQGGDPHAAIERALQEHEAAQKSRGEITRRAAGSVQDTLSGRLGQWVSLGERRRQLAAAQREAADRAASLVRQHDRLEASRRPADAWPDPFEDMETAVIVGRLQRVADQTKTLRELDARVQDTQQLARVYGAWRTEVEERRGSAAHELLRLFGWVFAVLLAGVLASGAIRRGIGPQIDRRRAQQLRFMATLGVQLLAAAVVLLLIFGRPTQLSTVIGLVTAGLTVVLKDFIVAFLGWFVLMGRNGIRVGDWVEIKGVSGEVIEIGLLRTVLLEMGNWTETSHPTGRRVAFINSFAIEGHYFNFSTAGQWLWDEMQVSVPPDGDPYRMAEEIRGTVERATAEDAQEATQEWERVTRQYGTRPFSPAPAVDLRPTGNGLQVVVRYITRAPQRNERKTRIYEEIVAMLHRGRGTGPGA